MEQIRKGNDIKVYWEIITGGDGSEIPYELEGKALELYAQNAYEKVRISDFVANGNVIEWTFYGKDQKTAGVYSLTLIENNGSEGMRTVDECNAFELVTHSCKTGGNAESKISIETVRLRSVMTLSDVVPDKELNKNSTNVVENGAIAREFEKQNGAIAKKQDIIPDLAIIREGASKGATALQEHQDISGKANTSGRYPDMSVGFADDLVGRGESVPAEFSFRASGGKSIKDGTARIKRLKGNSVVWNNAVRLDRTESNNASISVEGGKINITPTGAYPSCKIIPYDEKNIVGHKYAVLASKKGDSQELYVNYGGYDGLVKNAFFESTKQTYYCSIYVIEQGASFTLSNIVICDLTKMFGAGNEPTTIEEYNARKPIVADEYAYNEGEVIHMTAEGIKSIGDNAWDEEWENGGISEINGTEYDVTYLFRTKNYIRVLPNTQYYFKKPIGVVTYLMFYDDNKNFVKWLDPFATSGEGGVFTTPNAPYMRFVCYESTYKNDITISLYHSGWKAENAKYQPYWEDTLPLPIIRKYFPDGMKSAGSAHDEIRYNKASGKWEYSKGKIKSVDLGTLEYVTVSTNLAGSYRMRSTSQLVNAVAPTSDGDIANILCDRYIAVSNDDNWRNKEGVCVGTNGYLSAYDADIQDAASFKSAMQGVMLYYESNDWEWVELDVEDQNFRDYYKVADFGTEEIIAAQPSAPISADIIYQFNAVDMIREHELEINELQRIIATMQAQLASLTSNNGGQ